MTWGPWAHSDSVEHLEAARNLAAGRGLVVVRGSGRIVPLYARPPLYSIFLAGMVAAGADPVEGVRWLNSLLFAGAIGLVGVMGLRAADHPALAVLVGLYLLANAAVLDAFTGMMTESLFLVLVLGQVLLLLDFVASGGRSALLAAMGLGSLASLTRFAGLACIPIVGLAAAWRRGAIRARLGLAVGAMALTAIPFLLWTLLLARQGSAPGVYNVDTAGLWQSLGTARFELVAAYWRWLPWLEGAPQIAYRVKLLSSLLLAGTAGVLVWRLVRREADRGSEPPRALVAAGLLGTFSLAHAAVVALAYAVVVFPRPALNVRVLLPSQVTFLLALAFLGWGLLARWGRRGAGSVLVAAVLLPLILGSMEEARSLISDLAASGGGYAARGWRNLPIMGVIETLPADAPLISDDIDAIMFHTGRPAYRLPDLEQPVDPSEWGSFGSSPASGAEVAFAERGGYLVLFSSAPHRLAEVYGGEAQARLESLVAGLTTIYDGPDGAIYVLSSSP
jgi:hypothetical protein